MKDDLINDEIYFLIFLNEITKDLLFKAVLQSNNLPKNFDGIKAIKTIERLINAEVDYLNENPDDYLDLYGNGIE